MSKIEFTKMHGLGNDYIYIDADRFPIEDPAAFSIRWSKPHTGIGSDGLILISRSDIADLTSSSRLTLGHSNEFDGSRSTADFKIRIFNADGTEAMMCGNGSRCVGKYVYDKKLTDKTSIRLETLAGIKVITLSLSPSPSPDGRGVVTGATVDMGEPVFEDESLFIPSLLTKSPLPTGEGLGERLGTFVSMGNPHYVVFLDHIPSDEEVTRLGREMEFAPAFPQRCNIEFATMIADQETTPLPLGGGVVGGAIRMRVWERGSGITQACGTGACATAVAAFATGRAPRSSQIVMDGGTLQIEWREADNRVYMTGPAETAFEGVITLG